MRVLLRSSLVGLLAASALPGLAADSPATKVEGLWQGGYICGGNDTGVDLRLKAGRSGDIQGTVEFYSMPSSKAQLKNAIYKVAGKLSAEGKLTLKPLDWIKKPGDYFMGTLDGSFSDGFTHYKGIIVECTGTQSFSIAKVGDDADAGADPVVKVPDDVDRGTAKAADGSAIGGFFSKLLSKTADKLKEAGDPVVVRGYVKTFGDDPSQYPLCLYDLKTKKLQETAVFGQETQHTDGSPGFNVRVVSPISCPKSEKSGQLVVTNYLGMSPEDTPFVGEKGTPSLGSTILNGFFTRHPYDGTPATSFPRVAITVTDWSQRSCWIAKATVWSSPTKSEQVPNFNVCWPPLRPMTMGNDATEGNIVMQQLDSQHSDVTSGNVRTVGPRAPMRGMPERYPANVSREPYLNFMRVLVNAMAWIPGAPTNLWVVGFSPD